MAALPASHLSHSFFFLIQRPNVPRPSVSQSVCVFNIHYLAYFCLIACLLRLAAFCDGAFPSLKNESFVFVSKMVDRAVILARSLHLFPRFHFGISTEKFNLLQLCKAAFNQLLLLLLLFTWFCSLMVASLARLLAWSQNRAESCSHKFFFSGVS